MPEKTLTRTGRPLKEHAAGTQVIITLQVPAELKLRLQTEAIASNRTLSQEAQRRLERSFSVQALQEDAVAIAVTAVLSKHLEAAMQALENDRVAVTQALEKARAEIALQEKQRLAEVPKQPKKRTRGANE